jgi:hypothetical protein
LHLFQSPFAVHQLSGLPQRRQNFATPGCDSPQCGHPRWPVAPAAPERMLTAITISTMTIAAKMQNAWPLMQFASSARLHHISS